MKKIEITQTQALQFNRMRETLRRIGAVKGERTTYMTTDQLRNDAAKGDMGIDYEEELEMAYENMQADAKQAVTGIKEIKLTGSELEAKHKEG
jgi:hypothetical protein